jgi:hypothetical protein
MANTVIDFEGTIIKHVSDTLVRYADFGPMLASGETVSSATAVCAADTALTIGTPAVLSVDTAVPAKTGTRTITANEGISFALSGGTVIAEDDEPVRITIAATLSTGKVAVRTARLRVAE